MKTTYHWMKIDQLKVYYDMGVTNNSLLFDGAELKYYKDITFEEFCNISTAEKVIHENVISELILVK